MIKVIKNNLSNNSLDFKQLIRQCFSDYGANGGGPFCVEGILKSPKNNNYKTNSDDKKIFDEEFNKYLAELYSIYLLNGSTKEWNLADGNGFYIYPTIVRNEQFCEQFSKRFVRLYVGLNLRNIVEFFREFDKRAGKRHLNYYYKYHGEKTTDRFVIYPKNEHLFDVLEIINEIKKEKPMLFQNSLDKLLTTKVAPGIGLASDNPIAEADTFSTGLAKLIVPYLQEFYNNLPIPMPMIIKGFIIDYLLAKSPNKFNKTELKELITSDDCKTVIEAIKTGQTTVKLNKNTKLPYIFVQRLQSKLYGKSKNDIEKMIEKIGSFENFKKYLLLHISDFSYLPSENNIAFSNDQIIQLEKIYFNYLKQANIK